MPKDKEKKQTYHPLIAVDWGTTNFRAYLIDEYGLCIDSLSNNEGVLFSQGQFEATLQKHIGHWLNDNGSTTVILFGMVGSQVGWIETPYIKCPVEINSYGKHCLQLASFNQGSCWLVPGVKWVSDARNIDVMRGEELQVIGAYLLDKSNDNGLFCCPGTHNKWVSVNNGQINNIVTAMTGEIYSLLGKYSILAHSVDENAAWNEEAFTAGLKYSQNTGGILNHLFSVRTSYITGKHSQNEGSAYLSGLLIGHEIQSIITPDYVENTDITIIGSSQLCRAYSIALTYFNVSNKTVSAQASIVAGTQSLFNMIRE